MKSLLSIIAIGLLFACNLHNRRNVSLSQVKDRSANVFAKDTQINLDVASLVIPEGWRFVNDTMIPLTADATSRYGFYNKSGKLIFIEHGLSTGGERFAPYVVPAHRRQRYLKYHVDTSDILFSDDARVSEIRRRSKYKISFAQISGYPAIIYEPMQLGSGFGGVYIDSIGEMAGNLAQFALYAENLDSSENAELKKLIKTLVVKPFN